MHDFSVAAYISGTTFSSSQLYAFLPAKCPLKTQVWSRKRESNARCPFNTLSSAAANRRNEARNEEEDAIVGGRGQKFGMSFPNLNEKEKDYLEAATSNHEYMRRMTDIVRQKDQERRAAMTRESAQGPDEYLNSLARPKTLSADCAPPRMNAGDEYMEKLARISRGDHGFEEPPEVETHRSSAAPAGPTMQTNEQESFEHEDLEARINRLQERLARVKDEIDPNSTIEDAIAVQEAIRKDIGLDSSPETAPEPMSQPAPKPQAIEKQIDFLENYLERLKREEAEEGASMNHSDTDLQGKAQMKEDLEAKFDQLADKFTPQIEGLGDTPGGMSAAEKKAAFQQLRERAMKSSKPDPQFIDPYNTVLPSEKTAVDDGDDGDEPSPSSEAEYEDIGSQLHNKDLLIEEIEVEVSRYVTKAKSLLQNHDARMQVLLARLRALS